MASGTMNLESLVFKVYADATQYIRMMKTVNKEGETVANSITKAAQRAAAAQDAITNATTRAATAAGNASAAVFEKAAARAAATTKSIEAQAAKQIAVANTAAKTASDQAIILANTAHNLAIRRNQTEMRLAKATKASSIAHYEDQLQMIVNLQDSAAVRIRRNAEKHAQAIAQVGIIQQKTVKAVSETTKAISDAAAAKAQIAASGAQAIADRGLTKAERRANAVVADMNNLVLRQRAEETRKLTIGAAAVFLPIAAVARFGIREFENFDEAIHKSMARMDTTSQSLKYYIEMQSLALAGSGVADPQKIAESYGLITSAGYSAAEATKMLAINQKLALVGNMDFIHTGDKMMTIQRNFGLATDDVTETMQNYTRVADILARASQIGHVSVEQLIETLSNPKLGASVKTYGKSIEEIAAMATVFANGGMTGNRSGVGIFNLYREISSAMQQKPAAFQRLGINPYDDKGNFKDAAEMIHLLEQRFQGYSDKQKAATLTAAGFTRISVAQTQALIGTSAALELYNEEYKNAKGSLDSQYITRMQSFLQVMNHMWNQLRVLGILIGTVVAPYLKGLSIAISWVLAAVLNLNPSLRTFLAYTLGLMVIITLVGVMIKLAAAFGAFSGILAVLKVGMGTFSVILAATRVAILWLSTTMWSSVPAYASMIAGTHTLSGALAGLGISARGLAILAYLGPPLMVLAAAMLILGSFMGFDRLWESAKTGFGGLYGLMANFSENWKILVDFMGESWGAQFKGMISNFKQFLDDMDEVARIKMRHRVEDAAFKVAPMVNNQLQGLVDTFGGVSRTPPAPIDPSLTQKRQMELNYIEDLKKGTNLAQAMLAQKKDITGLPKFNTSTVDTAALNYEEILKRIGFPGGLPGGGLGDILNGGMGHDHAFTEFHPSRMMIDSNMEISSSKDVAELLGETNGYLSRIENAILTGIQTNRDTIPSAPGEHSGMHGHTGPNPAHAHTGHSDAHDRAVPARKDNPITRRP